MKTIFAWVIAFLPMAASGESLPAEAPNSKVIYPIAVGSPHICGYGWYPLSAVRNGEQGIVTLVFDIGLDGRVKNTTVAVSSAYPDLDAAAIACANEWKYRPATLDGAPFEKRWSAKISWTLGGVRLAEAVSPTNPEPIGTPHICDTPPTNSSAAEPTILFLAVDRTGAVVRQTMIQSSGNTTLDQYGIACSAKWLFDPKKKDSLPGELGVAVKLDWKK